MDMFTAADLLIAFALGALSTAALMGWRPRREERDPLL